MAQLNDLLSNIYNIKNDMKQVIINKGQTVTNFASYPNAILNITSGSSEGDILLFSNLNEMNSYTNANTGDLALVYDMNTNNLQALWQYTTNNAWELTPTGLTANREYVNSARFWGANGVETGVLQVNNNLTAEQVKIKAQVFNDLSELTLDQNINSLQGVYYNEMDWRSQGYKGETLPFINCPYVTNMSQFMYQSHLKSLSGFNSINVTNMRELFAYSTNLKNVPLFDTSNCVDMQSMFVGCSVLCDVPNFNTINCTNTVGMFESCYNLTEAPELDLSNVLNVNYMFQSCNHLINIPMFNIYKATNAHQMFYYCNNLSNEAYANIANSLPNITNLSNHYISNLGLNINKFTNEQINILNVKGYVDAIVPDDGLDETELG